MSEIPNNLPRQLTGFVGREADVAEIMGGLQRGHLVTLVGAGGLGKTRLSIEVAGRVQDRFPGGVWFIDFSGLAHDHGVLGAVASALGLLPALDTHYDPFSTLSRFLGVTETLLIFDNCEHVITGCAVLANDLLGACPGLRILATSRQPLNIPAEIVCRMSSLRLPAPEIACSLDSLRGCEAVDFFLGRVAARGIDFQLTPRNSAAVTALCRDLDGMPLALEMASSWLKVLSVEQVVERLDERFRLLAWVNRTAPTRQQSLQALMDWSYSLLSSDEQRLLLCLSVFEKGFTLDACRAVSAASGDYPLLDLLAGLVDKSLVIREEQDGETRYRLFETTRLYAAEKLSALREEQAQARNRHLNYYRELAEDVDARLAGPDQARLLQTLRVEYRNLRGAMLWAASDPDDEEQTTAGMRIAWSLRWSWMLLGSLTEGQAVVGKLLAAPAASGETKEAVRLRIVAGLLAWYQGDDTMAHSFFAWAEPAARKVGDAASLSFALNGLGVVARKKGDYDEARALTEEALCLDEQEGDSSLAALSLLNLGRISVQRGLYTHAAVALGRSHEIYRAIGDCFGTATAAYELGHLATERRQYTRAGELLSEAMSTFVELGVKFRVAQCAGLLAEIAAIKNRPDRVATLYGTADALFTQVGSFPSVGERLERERNTATARITASNREWDTAWDRGASMSMHEALEYARLMFTDGEAASPAEPEEADQPLHALLTPRELEVLKLVAENMTGAQVASRLLISRRTVEGHVQSIYTKLEITGRSELQRYARENNLV